MAVTSDISRSWRHPRAVMRQMLGQGPDEGRALFILMGSCLLIFVSQCPRLARAAQQDPSVPMDARMGVTLFALIFMAPLIFYGIAAVSHLVARALGGRGSWFSARLALFWALLCSIPAMLVQGLAAGLIGPGGVTQLVGVGVALIFAYLWINMLIEAETT
jgi:Yip1 domain